jgi:hypothetical protein
MEETSVDYENVFFHLKPQPEADKDEFGRAKVYTLSIRSAGREASETISLPWEEIDRRAAFLRDRPATGLGQLRHQERHLEIAPPFESLVRELGEQLYLWLFHGDVSICFTNYSKRVATSGCFGIWKLPS